MFEGIVDSKKNHSTLFFNTPVFHSEDMIATAATLCKQTLALYFSAWSKQGENPHHCSLESNFNNETCQKPDVEGR